eukprot:1635452-Rhodomonas_salina.2
MKNFSGTPEPEDGKRKSGVEPDDVRTDMLTPKLQSLENRLEMMEQARKVDMDKQQNGAKNGTASFKGAKNDQQTDLDMLFADELPEETLKRAKSEGAAEEPEPSKLRAMCGPIWGGPVAPYEDDTIPSWVSNFFGGVTTAHGINRVFDDVCPHTLLSVKLLHGLPQRRDNDRHQHGGWEQRAADDDGAYPHSKAKHAARAAPLLQRLLRC